MSAGAAPDLPAVSPEFAALTACLRWPRDPAAVRARAAGIDWDRFAVLARRHRVEGIVAAAIDDAGIAPPAKTALAFTSRRRRIAERNLRLLNETKRLTRIFAARGIAAAFVKGATLAELAWHDQSFKAATDVDLVVPPADVPATIALLRAEGYRLDTPRVELTERRVDVLRDVLKEAAFRHDARRVMVDLHWRLTSIRHLLPEIDPARDIAHVTIDECAIPTLRGGLLLDYLAVHGARHAWGRLKWLADFNALLAGKSAAEVTAWYRAGVASGIAPCAGLALWQSARMFETPLPPDIADRIAASRRVRWLAAKSDRMMIGGDELNETPEGPVRAMAYTLLGGFRMGDRPRYLLACVSHAWVAPRDAMALPLPRALRPLYLLISPVMRLGRGVGKLGRALVAKKGFARTAAGPIRAGQEN